MEKRERRVLFKFIHFVVQILSLSDDRRQREKVAYIRYAYQLPSRYDRLRTKGYLTANELSAELGVSMTTIHHWGRNELLRRQRYDQGSGCLYEPLQDVSIIKGHGGRGGRGPSFTARSKGRDAV